MSDTIHGGETMENMTKKIYSSKKSGKCPKCLKSGCGCEKKYSKLKRKMNGKTKTK